MHKISETLCAARQNVGSFAKFPCDLPETLEEAYEIQLSSLAHWPETVAGWKVGGIPPEFEEKYNAQKLTGPIFHPNVVFIHKEQHAEMGVYPDGYAAIEAEFIIELGDVSAVVEAITSGADVDKSMLLNSIKAIYIGVEIASSPLQNINDIGPAAVVCDFGNNGGLIVGPEVPNWRDIDLSEISVRVDINDKKINEQPCPKGMAGPFGAARFLIEHLHKIGHPVPTGTFISTGAITGVHDSNVGDIGSITFEGIGALNVTLRARQKMEVLSSP